MNAIIQNMLDRHSCRSFTAQPVEAEKIDDLITAAVWAPSGMNKQTWHFTVITNPEKIQQLAAAVLPAVFLAAAQIVHQPLTQEFLIRLPGGTQGLEPVHPGGAGGRFGPDEGGTAPDRRPRH